MSFDIDAIKLKMEEFKKKIATEAAEQIAADTRSNILSLGNKLGLKPLKPSTIRKKGHSHILVDTGAMARSIKVGETSEGNVGVGISNAQEEIARYALIHEEGSGRIPRRTFLQATAESRETKNRIKNRLEKTIQKSLIEIFD